MFALFGLVFGDAARMGLVWLGFLAVQIIASWYAFALDREKRRVLWSLPLQQFVYRQLMYLVVIQSVVTALLGTRLGWQRMQRHGLTRIGDTAPTILRNSGTLWGVIALWPAAREFLCAGCPKLD